MPRFNITASHVSCQGRAADECHQRRGGDGDLGGGRGGKVHPVSKHILAPISSPPSPYLILNIAVRQGAPRQLLERPRRGVRRAGGQCSGRGCCDWWRGGRGDGRGMSPCLEQGVVIILPSHLCVPGCCVLCLKGCIGADARGRRAGQRAGPRPLQGKHWPRHRPIPSFAPRPPFLPLVPSIPIRPRCVPSYAPCPSPDPQHRFSSHLRRVGRTCGWFPGPRRCPRATAATAQTTSTNASPRRLIDSSSRLLPLF
jgi:hypothetical protein